MFGMNDPVQAVREKKKEVVMLAAGIFSRGLNETDMSESAAVECVMKIQKSVDSAFADEMAAARKRRDESRKKWIEEQKKNAERMAKDTGEFQNAYPYQLSSPISPVELEDDETV